MKALLEIVARHKRGENIGIYSVCRAVDDRVGGIGKLIQPVEQAQRLQPPRVYSNVHARITGFDPLQARPTGKSTVCDHGHG